MASIAEVTASNQQHVVTIAGQDYPAKTLNMLTLGRMQAIINKIPDPKPWKAQKADFLELRDMGAIDDAEYRRRTEEAAKESHSWPPDVLGDPRAMQFLFENVDMMAAVVAGALRVTLEKAMELLQDIDYPLYNQILNIGLNSPGVEREAVDPKDQAPPLALASTG